MGSPAAGVWAQGATPAASPAPLPPLVAAYGAAWSSHDPEQVASLYVDDARFEEVVAGGAVTSNRAEFTGYLTELFAAFPDFALSPTGGFAAGDEIGLEWTVTGTYRGQFGTLPPGAGQRIALRGASMLQIDAGKIWSDREYWDAATLLAQVGALPGPGAATPATS
ncbi:MAG TPA: ester cyclase [Thermomicrobiales bacterium]|nr:ester cyclase [Thermomicrobiales bacterium]